MAKTMFLPLVICLALLAQVHSFSAVTPPPPRAVAARSTSLPKMIDAAAGGIDDFEQMKQKEIKKIRRIQAIQDMCNKSYKTSSFALVKQAQFIDKLLNVNENFCVALGREPTIEEWAAECDVPKIAFQRYITTGFTAKVHFLDNNMPLVKKAVRNYVANGGDLGELSIPELQQEAIFGLIGALETYNPSRASGQDGQFSSYATYWIRTSIRMAVAKKTSLMQFPTSTLIELDRILSARPGLVAQLGGPPSDTQLAKHLGLSVEKLRYYQIYLKDSPLDSMATLIEKRQSSAPGKARAAV
mmetsp:Transcript_912/g.1860  ORF Transcript_912/g.1860 Transcript_912/m.1860 type:complete len:300 (+) Transcript_912:102-1001(+)